MIALLLNPVVLCVLVWLVARGTADIDFPMMFFIALGVGIVGAVAGMGVGGGSFSPPALFPGLGLLVFSLLKYFSVSLQQALLLTARYFSMPSVFAALLY